MTVEEKKQWSIKMGMAVLLGKNIYNISELVSCKQINHVLYSSIRKFSRFWLALTLSGYTTCYRPSVEAKSSSSKRQ